MMRQTFSFLLCTLFFFFIQAELYAQEKLLAIRQHESDGFTYYDYNGKALFSSPPKYEPCLTEKVEPFKAGNFLALSLPDKVVPIKGEGKIMLYSTSGKLIKNFPETHRHVAPAYNGYLRGFERLTPGDNSTLILYYDLQGNRTFGDGKYWEGSDVIDGKALVQIYQPGVPVYEQKGDWLLIDSNGITLKNLSFDTGEPIYQVKEQGKDYWEMSLKGKSGRLFIKPNGEFSNKRFETEKEIRNLSKALFIADSLAITKGSEFRNIWMFSKKTYFEDKAFIIGHRNNPTTQAKEFILWNHLLEEVPLHHGNKTAQPFMFIGDRHLLAAVVDGEQVTALPIFDLQTLKSTGIIDRKPDDIQDDLLIYYSEDVWKWKTVSKILDTKGQVIYSPPIEDQVFTTVAEALKYPTRARKIKLENATAEDLKGIEKLTQLEIFELKRYQGERLPELKWKNLHTLYFYQNEKLVALPESFKSLTELTTFTMLDSDLITSIDDFLAKWPKLKTVKTTVRVEPEVKKLYPNVKFEETLVMIKME